MSEPGLMFSNPNHLPRRSQLRRIIVIGTALSVLIGATAAFAAALNTYTAKQSFSPVAAGSAAAPIPAGRTEVLTAKGVNGHNAAPLIDIKTTVYGMTLHPKGFPTCSAAAIIQAHTDTGCPKGALVATGSVVAQLGSPSLMGATSPCNPLLHVWNAGGGTVEFFFVITATHQCASITTGATAPYPGKFTQSGKNLVEDVPLPPDVSTSAGNLPIYGSLVRQNLTYRKLTETVKGKKVGFLNLVGCKAGKRPYSVKFTATNGSTKSSSTVTGAAKC
jgi:hypothetical protein